MNNLYIEKQRISNNLSVRVLLWQYRVCTVHRRREGYISDSWYRLLCYTATGRTFDIWNFNIHLTNVTQYIFWINCAKNITYARSYKRIGNGKSGQNSSSAEESKTELGGMEVKEAECLLLFTTRYLSIFHFTLQYLQFSIPLLDDMRITQYENQNKLRIQLSSWTTQLEWIWMECLRMVDKKNISLTLSRIYLFF